MLKQKHYESDWKNAIIEQKLKLDLSYKKITDAMRPDAEITPGLLNGWLNGMKRPKPSKKLYTPILNNALARTVQIDPKKLQKLYDNAKTILPPLMEWQQVNQLQRIKLEIPYGKLASEVNLIAATDFTADQMSNLLSPSATPAPPLTKAIVHAIAYSLELPKEKSWKLYKSKKTITLDDYKTPNQINKRAITKDSDKPSAWQSFVIARKDELNLTYRDIADALAKRATDIVPTFASIHRWLNNKKSPRPSLRIYTPQVNDALASVLKVEPSQLAAAYTSCETPLAPVSEVTAPLEVLLETLQSSRGEVSKDVMQRAIQDMIKTVRIFTLEAKPLTKHNINQYWNILNK